MRGAYWFHGFVASSLLTMSFPGGLHAEDRDGGHTMGSTLMFSHSGEIGEPSGDDDQNVKADEVGTCGNQDARLKALSDRLDLIDKKLEMIRKLLEQRLGGD